MKSLIGGCLRYCLTRWCPWWRRTELLQQRGVLEEVKGDAQIQAPKPVKAVCALHVKSSSPCSSVLWQTRTMLWWWSDFPKAFPGFCGLPNYVILQLGAVWDFLQVSMPTSPTHKQNALQAKFVPCTHHPLGSWRCYSLYREGFKGKAAT